MRTPVVAPAPSPAGPVCAGKSVCGRAVFRLSLLALHLQPSPGVHDAPGVGGSGWKAGVPGRLSPPARKARLRQRDPRRGRAAGRTASVAEAGSVIIAFYARSGDGGRSAGALAGGPCMVSK
jgi:hypothetical protein